MKRSANTNPPPRVIPRNTAVASTAPVVALSTSDLDGTITLGQSVALSWPSASTSTRTVSVTPAAGAGRCSGSLGASGTRTVTPTARGTYTYKITGVGTSTVVAAAVLRVQ